MPKLNSLAEIDSVSNIKHRTILQALRDTNLSVSDIAERVNYPRSTIYYVIREYLPREFLSDRNQAIQLQNLSKTATAKTKDEDPVIVIDSVEESSDHKPTEHRPFQKKVFSAESHGQKKSVCSAQDSRAIETSDGRSDGLLKNQDSTDENKSFTIVLGSISLRWENVIPEDSQFISKILAVLQERA